MKALLAIFLLLLVFAALYGFNTLTEQPTAAIVVGKQDHDFMVTTLADCSDENNKIVCIDTVYYRCNNVTKKVEGNIIKCNNITFSVDPIKQTKKEFNVNWKDPRYIDWLKVK
ncbi:MAG TPA: hypothetical protein VJA47_01515 [archaeon]|nr:hypothetical protein [archaeon]